MSRCTGTVTALDTQTCRFQFAVKFRECKDFPLGSNDQQSKNGRCEDLEAVQCQNHRLDQIHRKTLLQLNGRGLAVFGSLQPQRGATIGLSLVLFGF